MSDGYVLSMLRDTTVKSDHARGKIIHPAAALRSGNSMIALLTLAGDAQGPDATGDFRQDLSRNSSLQVNNVGHALSAALV